VTTRASATLSAVEGRLLVVEDDPQVRTMLVRNLSYEGFEVDAVADVARARSAISLNRPDLVLLDLMLPDGDGTEICQALRAAGDRLPIIMVTARDTTDETIGGLELGADDYVVKPFATSELVARVRSILRRARSAPQDGPLRVADLELTPDTREAFRGPRALELTRREFDLLETLMRHSGTVLTRDRLLTEAWDYQNPVETNAVDVYVGYLRRKLEGEGEERLLWTVRGVGYVLREERH
jgi:two-component system response regulator MprA